MAVSALSSRNVPAIFAILVAGALGAAAAEPALFESRQLTPSGEYPKGIEGPAVDAMGNLYVPNFQERGTIGKLRPGASKSELFARLPNGSIGNGIRFDRDGRMYVADFKQQRFDERGRLGLRHVHLPIGCDDFFAHLI